MPELGALLAEGLPPVDLLARLQGIPDGSADESSRLERTKMLAGQWERYIAQPTFFANLVGGTLGALAVLTLKDRPELLVSTGMLVGLSCLMGGFAFALLWRWSSQWAMELEVLGGAREIGSFFVSIGRTRYVTGASAGGSQEQFENRLFKPLRMFMKVAAALIAVLYLAGILAVLRGVSTAQAKTPVSTVKAAPG
ncbi:MAG: hypothetical protein ABI625_04075 [bacterium]